MPLIPVDALDDPRLDDYRNLSDAALLTTRGLFIAEGRLVVRRLLEQSRFAARSVLVTPAARTTLADLVPASSALPLYEVTQAVMNAVAGFNIHRGCLAAGIRGGALDWRDVTRGAQTVVVLERVADPDNVGALFRSAAALGAGGVLLDPASTDPLYRKAIRTSMGATLHLPFARMTDWPADLRRLREAGVVVLALTPAEDAPTLADWVTAHLTPRNPAACASASPAGAGTTPRRVALLLGHEGTGLSAEALQAADARVRIPVTPEVDSLNVAVAGAIALYEMARLRTVGASAG